MKNKIPIYLLLLATIVFAINSCKKNGADENPAPANPNPVNSNNYTEFTISNPSVNYTGNGRIMVQQEAYVLHVGMNRNLNAIQIPAGRPSAPAG